MVLLTQTRLQEESDFCLVAGNVADFDTETDYASNTETVNLDQIVASKGDYRKMVYGCRASGTRLPFPDAWFDSYVSNLVLQLIDSPVD